MEKHTIYLNLDLTKLYICRIYVTYMVKAMIDISEDANAVLNIVKAKHRLNDKSEAIERIAQEYEEYLLEIRPKFLEDVRKNLQEPYKEFHSVKEAFEILRPTIKKNAKNHSQARSKKGKTARKKDARSRVQPRAL